MSKSPVEKAIDKYSKESERAQNEAKVREYASHIVSGQESISGFRVMDADSETLLKEILSQYDGNPQNHVRFSLDRLHRSITSNIAVQYEKLKMYGVLNQILSHGHGGTITLSDCAKTYFEDKEAALKRADEEKAEKRRLAEIEAASHIHKQYDVFISHASSDKESYVDELAQVVKRLGINVFYDKDVLSWGDNWKKTILNGTADSEFAIIVISRNFFGREWTEKELNEFLNRQNEDGQKIILPLLHEISRMDLLDHYPALEEIQYISSRDYSKEGIAILLARELIKRYK